MKFNDGGTTRGGSVSADFSVSRGGSVGAPKKSFGSKLGVYSANPGHAQNVLQTRGLSAKGAQELMNGQSMSNAMDQMNPTFLALQEATQMESRKFQTLSNASKARHDIALKSIRNMK